MKISNTQFLVLAMTIATLYAQLLITSVSLSNDVISQKSDYTFQIIRFGDVIQIPLNTTIQISFPNAYASSTVDSCVPLNLTGVTSLSCSYSSLKLKIPNVFTSNSNIQSFGIVAKGISNPIAANTYSQFQIRLIYPNNTYQNGTGGYSVSISTANATCSISLISGLVFGEGLMTITYTSAFIGSSSIGYLMKLSMLQSYASDPTNTDINPILSVSNTMLAKYLFEFRFTNTFNLTMRMPPSTQPQLNFIFIMTSNALGDYDKCYLSISGVMPNEFVSLSMSQAEVQSISNITISLLATSPILQSDMIRINLTGTSFNISNVSNYAIFTKGALGQKELTKANQVLTIRNIASYVIVSQIAFIIPNIGMPYSTKPQTLSIYIQTDSGYIRNLKTFSYVSQSGQFPVSTFTCLISQIGYSTSCTLVLQLNNEIKGSGYIEVKFPSGFRIPNGYAQCVSSGPNINSISNCNSYSLTNSIRVTGMADSSTVIAAGSSIQITFANLLLPTMPATHSITVSSRTLDDYLIDSSTITFATLARALVSPQIIISSSEVVTTTVTNYNINLQLPLTLGIPFILNLYIPFNNVSVPSVNGNLLTSVYNPTTDILTIQNVGNTAMTITGFQTFESTAPVTLSGNLSQNGVRYFYFTGYDIVMSTARDINVYSFTQSNAVVGRVFKGTFILSDLKINDVVKVPTAYYSISQGDCSSNCVCGPNGIIKVTQVNNYGSNVTQLSMNLINNGYISTSTFSINVYEDTGVFIKQTKLVSIRTTDTNILNVSASQTNPYYTQNSTYTFNVSMTTAAPSSSTNNYLAVAVPSTYKLLSWSCTVGCVPQPPPINGVLYLSISSTVVSFTLGLQNAVSFLSPIKMTASSLGDMDYGEYLPVPICAKPCRSCDTSNSSMCLSCYLWSSQNKLREGTCVSECPSGQFYNNTSLACQLCHSYCVSCVVNSTNCYSCKSQYFYFQMGCLTQCPIGYYETTTGQCGLCESNCLDCSSDTLCIKCASTSYLYMQSCWSSCSSGTYVNPLANQCLNCSANCASCDASGCNQCQSSYYLYNKNCYFQCPEGLYKAISTCQSCQSPCATCFQFSNNCTSCLDVVGPIAYYYLSNKCYPSQCPQTYYISPLDNVCIKCQSPCLMCNRTQCLSCQPGLYFFEGYCSTQCQSTTYPNDNLTCSRCVAPCLTCSSATYCLTCQSPFLFYNYTCIRACPDGYYEQGTICKACVSPCLTCLSSSLCQSCSSLSLFNSSCVTSCPQGYYSATFTVLNRITNKCAICVLPCLTCTSQTSCLSCKSGLVLYETGCQSKCPDQYYENNGICFACSYPCKLCNSTGCITCANNQLYLQRQQCHASCTQLHPNNSTMMCQVCKPPCSTCTWSTVCLSCIDPYIFYQGQCIRTCPSGKYNANQLCVDCPSLCATCYLAGDQLRCPTCKSGNYIYGYECVSICPADSILDNPYCLSISCAALTNCKTCTHLRCLQCDANYTLNSATLKCEQIQQQQTLISAVSEIPVPFPFLIATVLIIVLGFLIRIQFNKMFTPLFIYAFAGIAECGSFALWLALIYVRGINQTMSGYYLKFAATALIIIYIFFNLVGFVLHIKVTRKDRKFLTWEKQDNKSSSITITIVALIFSFRFSILKYSKLGHLLRFSATLSHDNKMSHQNLLAYLSILIISIPAVVLAAWVAYLQQTMNYLFFTSIEVAILAVVMIILSIIQTLTPKGYTLQKKQDYKQGHDADHIQGESLQEMMVKMGIVQEEYHEGKELSSQQGEVRARNNYYHDDQQNQGGRTTQAFAFTKGEDQKLSIQSDIHQIPQSNYQMSEHPYVTSMKKVLSPIDQKQQLQNILMEAERRAEGLNRPSRPIGTIKRQSLKELEYQSQQSEGIESDEEPPPIDAPRSLTKISQNKGALNKQKKMTLNQDLKTNLQIQQRRMGMRKLQHLFDKLKIQQRQQKQLRERLERVTEQEKSLKAKQYERARQLIQRNQMNVEDKISKVQQMLSARNARQSERKTKMKQMESKRKQDRVQRIEKQSLKRNIIYPINEDINQSIFTRNYNIQIQNLQADLSDEVSWNEEGQAEVDFNPNHKWQITKERQMPQLLQNKQQNKSRELPAHQPQRLQDIEIDHWPIDPELQLKIKEVQERADKYIKQPSKTKSLMEEFDIQLQSDIGTGVDDILYKENEPQDIGQAAQQHKNEQFLEFEDSKISKKRINRSVIDLSPNKKNKGNN